MRKFIDIIDRDDDHYSRTNMSSTSYLFEKPGFKEWFSGSKVHDDSGNPLVCYHGTFEDFSEFKLQSENRRAYGFNRLGFWFDVSPETPSYFSGKSGNIKPCVLSIKKPFYLDSEFLYKDDTDKLRQAHDTFKKYSDLHQTVKLDDLGNYRLPDGKIFDFTSYKKSEIEYDTLRQKSIAYEHDPKIRDDAFNRLMSLLPNGSKSSDKEVDSFKQSLIDEGHDGIYLGDTAADFATRNFKSTDWFVAFYPNQIKSIFSERFSSSSNIMENNNQNL